MLNFRNLEFYDTVDNILDIIQKSDISSQRVKAHIEALLQFKGRAALLRDSVPGHKNSTFIDKKFKDAKIYLTIIKTTIDSMQKLSPDLKDESMQTLKYWIHPVRKDMNTKAKSKQAIVIHDLWDEYSSSDAVKQAVKQHGLLIYLERITELNLEMQQLAVERLSDLARMEEIRENFREEIVFELELLVYALISEVKLKSEEADQCYQLCNLINKTVAMGRTTQKSLATRRHNNSKPTEQQTLTMESAVHTNENHAATEGSTVSTTEQDSDVVTEEHSPFSNEVPITKQSMDDYPSNKKEHPDGKLQSNPNSML